VDKTCSQCAFLLRTSWADVVQVGLTSQVKPSTLVKFLVLVHKWRRHLTIFYFGGGIKSVVKVRMLT
jgi:hypothetical protein